VERLATNNIFSKKFTQTFKKKFKRQTFAQSGHPDYNKEMITAVKIRLCRTLDLLFKRLLESILQGMDTNPGP
jgi:hypothetical protein